MTRTIWYISGTRADYGLMRSSLEAIAKHDGLRLGVLVTGMHLDPIYGETVREIEEDGFDIVARVSVGEGPTTGSTMARGIGRMIMGFTNALERGRPDLVLLLGDRGEMLAGAIAAIHLDIPIVHIHGGERSGTVDEPIRHAISKLSHYHFTATKDARERLCRMGERADTIFVVGAPGLVGLTSAITQNRRSLAEEAGFNPERPIALFVYHPVLQDAKSSGAIAASVLDELTKREYQIVAVKPNSDSGSEQIRFELEARQGLANILVATHLSRENFVNWMAIADLMVGNSSAGIIEAASFGTPVVNIGTRQNLRERNANVIDVKSDAGEICRALDLLTLHQRFEPTNLYGDGASDQRIATLLATVPTDGITWKSNVY